MVIDLLFVSGGFVAVLALLNVAKVKFAGQAAILTALALATWRLALVGQSWADVGLRTPGQLWLIPFGVALAYIFVVCGNVMWILPLAKLFRWKPLNLEKLGDLHGNLPLLLRWLFIAWTTAAFGEELVFRGFLLTRLEGVLGAGALAPPLAIITQAILFGAGHFYQGVRGIVTAGFVGLVFGVLYLVVGRNLWPLIVAHGVIDSVSLFVLYARGSMSRPQAGA